MYRLRASLPLGVAGFLLAWAGSVASSSAATVEMVYSFKGGTADVSAPLDGLVKGAFGAYYGVAASGGANGDGGVFQLTFAGGNWTEKLIYSFTDAKGTSPGAQLITDAKGALYGTTQHGGSAGQGVIYKLTPPAAASGVWSASLLHSFTGDKAGQEPRGRLLMDAAGALYGTTYNGGDSNSNGGGTPCLFGCGGVFKLTPPKTGSVWLYSVIHKFQQGMDGSHPVKGLAMDTAGVLYGTTLNGGSQGCNNGIDLGCGIVFKLTPPTAGSAKWTENVILRFRDNNNGQSIPSDLYVDAARNVFGGAPTAGVGKVAIVYELSPAAGGAYKETTLHRFTSASGVSALIADSSGTLYGTTNVTGTHSAGSVFEFLAPSTPGGARTFGILYNFTPGQGYSLSNLLQADVGKFLGFTQSAGVHGRGSVYQLTK